MITFETRNETLEKAILVLSKNLESTKKELIDAKEQLACTVRSKASLADLYNQLFSSYKHARSAAAENAEDNARLSRENEKLKKEIDRLKKKDDSQFEDICKRQCEEIMDLRAENGELFKSYEKMRAELEDLQNNFATIKCGDWNDMILECSCLKDGYAELWEKMNFDRIRKNKELLLLIHGIRGSIDDILERLEEGSKSYRRGANTK